jgi:aryl-alcohol dehydrogenase-like predicted oxidoreductase
MLSNIAQMWWERPGWPAVMKQRRREFLMTAGALAADAAIGVRSAPASDSSMATRVIPATGERLPTIGMGSWITFNVGDSPELRDDRAKILQVFFDRGGSVIDSSPMYGTSQQVIGWCLQHTTNTDSLFAATKVWTLLQSDGPGQMAEARELWKLDRFDLMQVHNLVNWEGHLETLQQDKEDGRLRYIGITTSHGRQHGEFEQVMATQPIDFVQFTYNILDREAESRLLPLAAERGLGVIINRPFQRGALFDEFANEPLPDWAVEIDCDNWAQFFLKFIVSHPTVTCAIPATSRVDHMEENMGALYGALPDETMRRRMIDYVENL